MEATGAFVTQDSGAALVKFDDCEARKAKCRSPGAIEGEIITTGEVQLVDVLPTPPSPLDLGLWFKPGEEWNSGDADVQMWRS